MTASPRLCIIWACDYSSCAKNAPQALEAVISTRDGGDTAHNPITHYVVVRRDLPLGVQAAMLVHAAGESSPGGLDESTYAVVLAARDELDLTLIAERLEARGVRLVRIREPEAPWHGALMALGLAPARKEALRRHVSSLPLLR